MKRWKSFFLIFFCIVAFDILSKAHVNFHIPELYTQSLEYPFGGISVWHDFLGTDFSINHVTNKGGRMGYFS